MKFDFKKGFSLLEIVIATALLGLVLVTIGSVFAKGLEALKKGQKNAVALNIARKKIEEVVNIDYSDPDILITQKLLSSIEGYDPGTVSISPSGNTDLRWDNNIDVFSVSGEETVGDVIYSYDIKIEGYRPGLKKVSVYLKWLDFILKDEKIIEVHTFLARKGTIDYEYK